MLEKNLEKKICDYAKSKGCLVYKFSSISHRGVPDRILVGPHGKILFLEVKASGKFPTKLQEHEIRVLNGHGCVARWVNDFVFAKVMIDEHLLDIK